MLTHILRTLKTFAHIFNASEQTGNQYYTGYAGRERISLMILYGICLESFSFSLIIKG